MTIIFAVENGNETIFVSDSRKTINGGEYNDSPEKKIGRINDKVIGGFAGSLRFCQIMLSELGTAMAENEKHYEQGEGARRVHHLTDIGYLSTILANSIMGLCQNFEIRDSATGILSYMGSLYYISYPDLAVVPCGDFGAIGSGAPFVIGAYSLVGNVWDTGCRDLFNVAVSLDSRCGGKMNMAKYSWNHSTEKYYEI